MHQSYYKTCYYRLWFYHLPGVTLEEGVAIGAMSVVQNNCKSNFIYAGNPLKKIIPRSTKYKEFEIQIKNN